MAVLLYLFCAGMGALALLGWVSMLWKRVKLSEGSKILPGAVVNVELTDNDETEYPVIEFDAGEETIRFRAHVGDGRQFRRARRKGETTHEGRYRPGDKVEVKYSRAHNLYELHIPALNALALLLLPFLGVVFLGLGLLGLFGTFVPPT